MANSKIIYGNQTLVDLTLDSVTPDKVANGTSFIGTNGQIQMGTMQPSGASVSGTNISVSGNTNTVHWSTSSIADIAYVLNKYRNGEITKEDFHYTWLGEERTIQLTDGKTAIYIYEGREFNLVNTSLSGKALTIVPKYVQYYSTIRDNTPYALYWSSSDNGMRNFVNGTYYNKFPSDFKALLKQFQSWGGANDWFCVPAGNEYSIRTNPSGTAQAYATTQFYNSWSPTHIYYVNTSGDISHGATPNSYGAFPIGCI